MDNDFIFRFAGNAYDVDSCGQLNGCVACGQGALVKEHAADGVDGYFGRCREAEICLAIVAPYAGGLWQQFVADRYTLDADGGSCIDMSYPYVQAFGGFADKGFAGRG